MENAPSKQSSIWPQVGLTFGDALKRVGSRNLLAELELGPELANIQTVDHGWSGWIHGSRTDLQGFGQHLSRTSLVDKNEPIRMRAYERLVEAFYSHLQNGTIVCLAHASELQAIQFHPQVERTYPTALSPSAWNRLRIRGRNMDQLRLGKETKFWGVRFVPLLHSPLAEELLVGRSLQEVLEKFCRDDPEFVAACEVEGLERAEILHEAIEGRKIAESGACAIAALRVEALAQLLREGRLGSKWQDISGRGQAIDRSLWLQDHLSPFSRDLHSNAQKVRLESSSASDSPVSSPTEPDYGQLPPPFKPEACKRYVERVIKLNPHWKSRFKEHGFAAKLAKFIASQPGVSWDEYTLADELRRQFKEKFPNLKNKSKR